MDACRCVKGFIPKAVSNSDSGFYHLYFLGHLMLEVCEYTDADVHWFAFPKPMSKEPR